PPPPTPPPFPYTTLFRSRGGALAEDRIDRLMQRTSVCFPEEVDLRDYNGALAELELARRSLPNDPRARDEFRPHLGGVASPSGEDRKSTRLNSSHVAISY